MELELGTKMAEKHNKSSMLKTFFNLLRVNQWTKNGLVFAALVFSGQLSDPVSILKSCVGAVIFSMISSSIYILNDTLDAPKDRLHPLKKFRPIASGKVSSKFALMLMIIILVLFLPLAFVLSKKFLYILVFYLVIQILYCLYLKHMVLIDVFCVASGFVLRAIAGGVILEVYISPWLLLCTTLLSLFLALSKRRNELILLKNDAALHRRILEEYSTTLLDQLLSLVTASTLMAYSLYTFTSGKPISFMVTIIFVIYGLFRYLYLIYRKELGGSPEKLLISDIPLMINIILWGIVSVIILY